MTWAEGKKRIEVKLDRVPFVDAIRYSMVKKYITLSMGLITGIVETVLPKVQKKIPMKKLPTHGTKGISCQQHNARANGRICR